MEIKAVYQGPIPAPINKDDVIAKLVVSAKGFKTVELPLFAASSVGKLGFMGRLRAAASHIFLGFAQ